MRFAAAALHLLGLAVLVVGLLSTLLHAQLDDGVSHSSRPVHTRRALGGAAAPQQVPLGSFARVALDVPMASSAASGLAVLVRPGSTLLALANFYGKSTLYELDDGLRARRVQSFATAAAHDMEVAELPGGVTQFVCAEYDSKQGSLVFQLQERGAIPPAALAGFMWNGSTSNMHIDTIAEVLLLRCKKFMAIWIHCDFKQSSNKTR